MFVSISRSDVVACGVYVWVLMKRRDIRPEMTNNSEQRARKQRLFATSSLQGELLKLQACPRLKMTVLNEAL